jgi:broad-specificity NMP kinase
VKNPKIAIITGPPGVGKTTVAHATCERVKNQLDCIAVHVEVDDVRHMLLGDSSDYTGDPKWLLIVESILDRAITFADLILIEGLFHDLNVLRRLNNHCPSAKVFF